MTHVFYAFTFFVILYEISVLQTPTKVHVFVAELKRKAKSKIELNGKDYAFFLFQMAYLFWAWVGVFSSQWQLFVLLIVIGLIPVNFVWIRFVKSLVSLVILFAIVISKYHYSINLF